MFFPIIDRSEVILDILNLCRSHIFDGYSSELISSCDILERIALLPFSFSPWKQLNVVLRVFSVVGDRISKVKNQRGLSYGENIMLHTSTRHPKVYIHDETHIMLWNIYSTAALGKSWKLSLARISGCSGGMKVA